MEYKFFFLVYRRGSVVGIFNRINMKWYFNENRFVIIWYFVGLFWILFEWIIIFYLVGKVMVNDIDCLLLYLRWGGILYLSCRNCW